MLYSSQKGVSIFLSILILTIILAIVLGLSTILIGQVKTVRGQWQSVLALYAADTGVEKIIQIAFNAPATLQGAPPIEMLANGASYQIEVRCCNENPEGAGTCKWITGTPLPDCEVIDPVPGSCKASLYCISSVGTFGGTKRAIRVEI